MAYKFRSYTKYRQTETKLIGPYVILIIICTGIQKLFTSFIFDKFLFQKSFCLVEFRMLKDGQ